MNARSVEKIEGKEERMDKDFLIHKNGTKIH